MISNSQGTNYNSSSGDDDENISFVVVVVFNEYISCLLPHKNFFQVILINLVRFFFPKIISKASDYLMASTEI